MEYKEAFERIRMFCNSDNGYPYNQYTQSSTPRNEEQAEAKLKELKSKE